MNAGRIAFRRREPYYRAHVRVSASGCEPGEQWTFDLQPVSDDFTGLVHAQFACTPEVLVRYLKPGSYEIRLSSKTRWGVAYFEITKANVNVDLTLNAQMILNGRVLAAQDAKLPPMDKIKVRLPASTQPDGEGKFTVHKLMWPERSVIVYGLPPQDYVKEIRYNGVAIEGRNFNMAPGEGQQLEIVIDDKAGAITGTVTDADQPFPSAQVVVVKWPPPDGNAAPALASATADSSGRFQIAGLAPGEYRVIAFARGTDPGPTEQLKQEIASSERVSLDPGGSQSVALKISGR